MKKFISFSLIVLLSLSLHINAYMTPNLSISAFPDAVNGTVTLSGTGTGTIIITVISANDDESDLSYANLPHDIISINATGTYSVTMDLGSSMAGQRIKVVATDSYANSAAEVFNNPDLTDADDITNALAGADKDTFISVVSANAARLGIDTSDPLYVASSDKILELLYIITPANSDAATVYNNYRGAYAFASLHDSSQANIEQTLSNYDSYFGIDYATDYVSDTRLDAASKEKLCTILANVDLSKELKQKSFAAFFEESKSLAAIQTAKKWQDIQNVIETDFSSLFSLSAPNNITQIIYSKMMSMSFTSFDDISNNYIAAMNEIIYAPDVKKPVGGSGGGGGYVTLPTNTEITIPDDIGGESDDMIKKPMIILPVNPASNYTDVSSDHWCYEAVSALSQSGVISGYTDGSYIPDKNITRAEYTKLICTSFGIPFGISEFNDVDKFAWYYPYIGGAADYGIISGFDGNFNPDENISREDAVLIAYRALKGENIILNGAAEFHDKANISLYALSAVGGFCEYGIVKGDGMGFRPLDNITRAEAAQLLYNVISTANQMLNGGGR